MISADSISNQTGFEILKSTYTENKNMPQMHYHNHYEILYVYGNSRILTVGEKDFVLDKTKVALIPPYIPHMTVSGGILPQDRILINFNESFVHDIRKALPDDILSCFGAPCRVIPVENFIDEFCHITDHLSENLTENDLLLEFCRLLNLLSRNSSEPSSKEDASEIIRYVEANFSEKITLDLLAEKFFLSRFTVSRYFSRYTGTSLPKYLRSIRVINAKRYLKEGMKVTDVAFRCGFESTSNFDRVFLAQTGMSPSEYKKGL